MNNQSPAAPLPASPHGRAQDLSVPLTIDLDSTIVEVHGRGKQGAAFGYTNVPAA